MKISGWNRKLKDLFMRWPSTCRVMLGNKEYLFQAFKAGFNRWLIPWIELSIIGLWALWVGREYFSFHPNIIPTGNEFGSAVQTHHLWTQFQNNGWCAIWNGSTSGGYPAFADVHGSMLHPLVIFTTLIFGVVNGAKIALIASLAFAGLAQWWLAHELKLGWLPRMWSALVAVAGGHISSRMELGAFGVVLSIAMCSLVYPALIAVARRKNRRAWLLLAILLASAILAGQGYMQFGLLGALPALSFLILDRSLKIKPIWKEYALAIIVALLLAAYFLVPLAHFLPNFTKDMDPKFHVAQQPSYLPLNLVIDDASFYRNTSLDKEAFPHLYAMFIGWTPVLLAVLGLCLAQRKDRSIMLFLLGGTVMEFLIGSAILLRWLTPFIPSLGIVRHTPQIVSMAIPLILGLAAYGLDRLLQMEWPKLQIHTGSWRELSRRVFSLRWFLLIPLILNLQKCHTFSREWLNTEWRDNEIDIILDYLETPNLQWVEPPFGNHAFIEPAIARNLKITPGIMTWRWKGRILPTPVLVASQGYPSPNLGEEELDRSDDPTPREPSPYQEIAQVPIDTFTRILERKDMPYAAIITSYQQLQCRAQGTGGCIQVICDSDEEGILVVKENMWSGWRAWRDGKEIPLIDDRWIKVEAPAGKHRFQFLYLPWDVPLGIAITGIGSMITLWLWFHPQNHTHGHTGLPDQTSNQCFEDRSNSIS